MQSYLGNHWDLCFLYECEDKEGKIKAKSAMFESASYYDLNSLPRNEMSGDHLELIDALQKAK